MRVANGGTKVGKQAQVFAQAENGLFRAQWAVQLVVFPVAHGPEQHGVSVFGQLECGVRQRVAVSLERGTADERAFSLKLQVKGMEHLDSFSDDFDSDAVTRKDCDFHKGLFTIVFIAACARITCASA